MAKTISVEILFRILECAGPFRCLNVSVPLGSTSFHYRFLTATFHLSMRNAFCKSLYGHFFSGIRKSSLSKGYQSRACARTFHKHRMMERNRVRFVSETTQVVSDGAVDS
jgi:hypothetical protein